jgi:hypothetical protein
MMGSAIVESHRCILIATVNARTLVFAAKDTVNRNGLATPQEQPKAQGTLHVNFLFLSHVAAMNAELRLGL